MFRGTRISASVTVCSTLVELCTIEKNLHNRVGLKSSPHISYNIIRKRTENYMHSGRIRSAAAARYRIVESWSYPTGGASVGNLAGPSAPYNVSAWRSGVDGKVDVAVSCGGEDRLGRIIYDMRA